MKDLTIPIGGSGDLPRPICPYCQRELHAINDHRGHFKLLSNIHVFSCPHCNKALNVIVAPK